MKTLTNNGDPYFYALPERSFLIPLVHNKVAWPTCITIIKCSSTLIKVLSNPPDRWPSTIFSNIFQSRKHCISRTTSSRLSEDENVVKKPDVVATQRTRACTHVSNPYR